jgi:hypothetical protein
MLLSLEVPLALSRKNSAFSSKNTVFSAKNCYKKEAAAVWISKNQRVNSSEQ